MQMKPMSERRDMGGDFLRAILIAMIVIHHCVVHGLGLVQLRDGAIDAAFFGEYQLILNAVCIIGVNGFFWLSGFFGIRRNYKKLISIFFVCVFYSCAWNAIGFLAGDRTVSLSDVVNMLFPIKNYWFIAVYLVVALIAPYINTVFQDTSNREQLVLVGVLTGTSFVYGFVFDMAGVGNGYTVFQGINMYVIGVLCRNNREMLIKHRKECLLTFAICTAILSVVASVLVDRGFPKIAWRLFAYNNPIIMLSATSFCLLLVQRTFCLPQFVTKHVAGFSRLSLAVYLITDHVIARRIIYIPLRIAEGRIGSAFIQTLAVLLFTALLMAAAALVETARQKTTAILRKGLEKR